MLAWTSYLNSRVIWDAMAPYADIVLYDLTYGRPAISWRGKQQERCWGRCIFVRQYGPSNHRSRRCSRKPNRLIRRHRVEGMRHHWQPGLIATRRHLEYWCRDILPNRSVWLKWGTLGMVTGQTTSYQSRLIDLSTRSRVKNCTSASARVVFSWCHKNEFIAGQEVYCLDHESTFYTGNIFVKEYWWLRHKKHKLSVILWRQELKYVIDPQSTTLVTSVAESWSTHLIIRILYKINRIKQKLHKYFFLQSTNDSCLSDTLHAITSCLSQSCLQKSPMPTLTSSIFCSGRFTQSWMSNVYFHFLCVPPGWLESFLEPMEVLFSMMKLAPFCL